MKKITQTIYVLIALLITTGMSAQGQNRWNIHRNDQKARSEKPAQQTAEPGYILIGHSSIDDEIWPYDGMSLSYDARVGVGVMLTREMIEPYIGGKIIAMYVGWDDQSSSATYDCFVREEFTSEDITTGTGTVNFGWNLVYLNPIELPDTDHLCVGFYADIKKDVCSIPFLYPQNTPNTVFSYWGETDSEGKEKWYDLHTTPNMGKMPIILIIEDTNGQFVNLVRVDDVRYNPIVWGDAMHDTSVKFTNMGSNEIHQIEIATLFGEDEMSDIIPLDEPLLTGSSIRLTMPIYCMGTGTHQYSIKKVNRAKARGTTTVDVEMVAVPQELEGQYTHRPVLEFFCSEENYMIPKYFEEFFWPGFSPKANAYTLVCPHADDKYMTGDNDAIMQLLTLVDNDSSKVMMPTLTINRSYNMEYCASESNSIFHLGIPFPEAIAQIPMYDNILKKPTFASVNIAAQFDNDFEQVDITVNGNIAEKVLPESESLYLTVYLMEKNVHSMDQLFWDEKDGEQHENEFVHKNIIRDILSEFWGDDLNQSSGDYTLSYNVELDPEWNKNNLYVVAFLNRNVDNTLLNRNIINSNEKTIDLPGAVANVEKENKAVITTDNGTIYVNGEKNNVTVYNLAGVRLDNGNLPQGVYFIQCDDTKAKVLVK